MSHDLIDTWKNWHPHSPSYFLAPDMLTLSRPKSMRMINEPIYQNTVNANNHLTTVKSSNIQSGLIPLPYCGDVLNASIYLLFLNPAYSVEEHSNQLELPQYRQSAISNIHQDFTNTEYPFYFLDPKFSNTAGYKYWHTKLRKTIDTYSKQVNISPATSNKIMSQSIASIEMMPYWSEVFKDSDNWLRDLRSSNLARAFVADYILPKVMDSKATVIVTRKVREWNLGVDKNVILYTPGEARGAHLTPTSRGGEAILNRLKNNSI